MNIEPLVTALTKDIDKKFKLTFPNQRVAKTACSAIRRQFADYKAVLELFNIQGKLAIRYQGKDDSGNFIYIFGIFPEERQLKFTIEEL